MNATVNDVKVGNWLWLEMETAFNGEGGVSCPVRVQSVGKKEAVVKQFGDGDGLGGGERGNTRKVKLVDVDGGSLSKVNKKTKQKFVKRELAWIQSQRDFLDVYASELLG